jgi:hypothetical protein
VGSIKRFSCLLIDYNICIDKVGWTFQHDFGGKEFPICGPQVVGDAVEISGRLITKYPVASAA